MVEIQTVSDKKENQFFTLSSGHKYHYIDKGFGNPTIFVHGNPTWSYYFRNLIKEIASPSQRALAPDHIGHGYSAKPGEENYSFTLSQRVKDLSEWIESLSLKNPVNIVAHDWGGPISLGYAVRNPDKVNKLTMLNTTGFLLPDSKPLPPALSLVRGNFFFRWLAIKFDLFTKTAMKIGFKKKKISKEEVAQYLSPTSNSENARISVANFVRDIPLKKQDPSFDEAFFIQENLSKLKDHKFLIAFGLKDFVFDQHFLTKWKEYIPSAEFLAFKDAGHFVLEDEEAVLIPRIKRFLTS